MRDNQGQERYLQHQWAGANRDRENDLEFLYFKTDTEASTNQTGPKTLGLSYCCSIALFNCVSRLLYWARSI